MAEALTERFDGRNVLITGAGRGIGKRLALGFARAGARVGLLARTRAELDLVHLEIQHAGGSSLRLLADVRDYGAVCGAVRRMREAFGGTHVLVAAAAIQGPIGPLWSTDPEAWAATVEVNLIGVMHACRAVLHEMIERRSGKIIVLTGGGDTHPRPNFSAYAASKAAVARFVETLAKEVRDANVQVNCFSPGGTYTHMTDEILRAGERAGQKELERARTIQLTGGHAPDEQIALAFFLASQRSNHISGKILHVDDDWRRLEHTNSHAELFTLRRVRKL
ncbi:MAG: SDR family oxidoreductase [Bryobacterales bacterium]|nr:SDR family oxidoreductase [Bryobacteraceae bacterium]MDW8353146.1 SDR family oxidoreductase [Bryobacterales bacterium]